MPGTGPWPFIADDGDGVEAGHQHLSVETIYLTLYVLPLVLPARLEGTDARSAGHGFTQKLRHVPAPLRNTLTDDRGKEMAEHERLAQRLASQVFFAYPHSHWQRGINENNNGLLRSTCQRAPTCHTTPRAR